MKVHVFGKILRRTCTTGHGLHAKIEHSVDSKSLLVIEKCQQKTVNVAVLGCDCAGGEALSTLLKQNPLVAHLYLHGAKAKALAADLRDVDTRTMVCGYGELEVDKAIKRADIIVLMGLNETGESAKMCPYERFAHETERVVELTTLCTMYSPKSIMCVCIEPVSISLPLVSEIFRRTHWYHPARIIGSVALHHSKLCSLLAQYYNLDASGVQVPIIGGPDVDCVVPLFSRATPVGATLAESEMLTKRFKGLQQCESVTTEQRKSTYVTAPLSHGFAINRLVASVALGYLGDQNARVIGFVRSNHVPSSRYLASTLKMGRSGVYHNYGVPTLTGLELGLLEQAVLTLHERDKHAVWLLDASKSKRLQAT